MANTCDRYSNNDTDAGSHQSMSSMPMNNGPRAAAAPSSTAISSYNVARSGAALPARESVSAVIAGHDRSFPALNASAARTTLAYAPAHHDGNGGGDRPGDAAPLRPQDFASYEPFARRLVALRHAGTRVVVTIDRTDGPTR